MITDYLHQLLVQDPFHPSRPRLFHESLEEDFGRFCLNRQYDRAPATFPDVIDLIDSKGVIVDRLWAHYSVQWQAEQLCTQKATTLGKGRYDVSYDDRKRYESILPPWPNLLSVFLCKPIKKRI
jgi:hypothetical protein